MCLNHRIYAFHYIYTIYLPYTEISAEMVLKNIILLILVGTALTSNIVSQESLAVTIYNNNFAMVKDVRQISFD